jgi:hypothetical protein
MADTVTSQILVDGDRNAVIKLTNFSDGTGESSVLKVDVSALSGNPSSVRIDRVWYDIQGMTVRIQWDATTDVDALILGERQGNFSFSEIGGIQNNAGAGKTGDINLSTVGASLNDSYSIILWLRKS